MNIVIIQNAMVYTPYPAVMMFPSINTSLKAVTKYVKGIHCIIFNMVGWLASIDKFHTIGVNQKNICIAIDSKLEKSGTNVVIADVNLVKAIIKAYTAINT